MRELPMSTLAAWLSGHTEWLRHHKDGADAADEIRQAVRFARRVTDSPMSLLYVGTCLACAADMYAPRGSVTAKCRACGTVKDVDLKNLAEDYLLTASEASDVLWSALGQVVKAERIRKWAEREHIRERTKNRYGHPMYRFGDILDRLGGKDDKEPEAA